MLRHPLWYPIIKGSLVRGDMTCPFIKVDVLVLLCFLIQLPNDPITKCRSRPFILICFWLSLCIFLSFFEPFCHLYMMIMNPCQQDTLEDYLLMLQDIVTFLWWSQGREEMILIDFVITTKQQIKKKERTILLATEQSCVVLISSWTSKKAELETAAKFCVKVWTATKSFSWCFLV